MKIKITKTQNWNWYKDLLGETLEIRDQFKYDDLGVQVFRPDGKSPAPDVVSHGDYEVV